MNFWKDVRDLREAIKTNVDAGRGNRSLIEAVEQIKDKPSAPPPIKPKRRHLRTFVISALFGAIWQGTRR